MSAPNRYLIALPSTVTLLGVFCGFLCLIWAPHHPYSAGLAIIGASLCDMVDGRIARLTKTTSEFGVQLDSLADLASFGIAPAFLMWHWAVSATPDSVNPAIFPVFLYVVGCAVRLARFNLGATTEAPGFHITGLATPVAALFLTTLMMTSVELNLPALRSGPLFIAVSIVLTALMVSRIPFPSYKKFKSRPRQAVFFASIAGGLTLLMTGGPGGTVLCVLLCLYLIVGTFSALFLRGKDVTSPA
jgi:CDP-diacylglycerol--serine O-phosphatidyltransferase